MSSTVTGSVSSKPSMVWAMLSPTKIIGIPARSASSADV
jgi:hypothetical protein